MTLINLHNIAVTFAAPLFADLNLTISKGDRVGLVAPNGSGKSTLFRLIMGEMEATAGEITTARGLTVAMVAQDVPEHFLPLTLYKAVLDALDAELAETESWRVDIVLEDLQVPRNFWERPLAELSGGWQRVALLARAWVGEPDVLLLDEPTNHLDLGRIGILQEWMQTHARQVPFLIASHDRAFLDETTNRTFFLRPDGSQGFASPYSQAREALAVIDETAARQFENDMTKARQLRRQAAKLKNIGTNSGSDLLLTKTRQLKDRAEKIEDSARPAHEVRSAGSIKLNHSQTHAKALVSIAETDIETPDGVRLFRCGPLWINRGDRVVLLGTNGTGKTRLLNAVAAARGQDPGVIRLAGSVEASFVDQALSLLDAFESPLEAVTYSSDIGDHAARAQLAGAGMSVALQKGPISALSGGQRARLAMLLLRLDRPNFYILDEPTNHLDIEGQEALEQELQREGASALLVSHDRAFVRAVGTRFWELRKGKLVEVETPESFFEAALAATP